MTITTAEQIMELVSEYGRAQYLLGAVSNPAGVAEAITRMDAAYAALSDAVWAEARR